MSGNKKPKLRFVEFKNDEDWEEGTLSEICNITNGKANAQDHTEEGIYPLFDRSEVVKLSNEYIFDTEAVIIPGEGMKFIPKYYKGKFNLHQRAYALKDFKCDGEFVYHFMVNNSNLLSRKAVQSTVLSLRKPILETFPILLPPTPEEQQKISDCLTSLDELIEAQEEKLRLLKEHKKGLLQQLFPQTSDNQNVNRDVGGKILINNKLPKLRFPEFSKEWQEKTLGEVLNYERPDKYIVNNTNYKTSGTPVLTANKSFILGYTDEKTGIFEANEENPIIIFDDFTTDNKYVNFPFKVKSSAIKILSAKDENNLKFVYELISQIEFEAKEHKRYYISEYQNIKILLPPTPEEQQKIADCLTSLDEVIETQNQNIENLKTHKKGLLQQLFPSVV